jgi:Uma2 family endonuclease
MATAAGLTIDDFERLPEALARNHELIDGELVAVSGNTPQHNLFRGLLESLLRQFVEEHRLGIVISQQEFDFGGDAHGPDISFIREAKRPLLNMKLRVHCQSGRNRSPVLLGRLEGSLAWHGPPRGVPPVCRS